LSNSEKKEQKKQQKTQKQETITLFGEKMGYSEKKQDSLSSRPGSGRKKSTVVNSQQRAPAEYCIGNENTSVLRVWPMLDLSGAPLLSYHFFKDNGRGMCAQARDRILPLCF